MPKKLFLFYGFIERGHIATKRFDWIFTTEIEDERYSKKAIDNGIAEQPERV